MKIGSLATITLLALLFVGEAKGQQGFAGEGVIYTPGPNVEVLENVHVSAEFNSGSSFMDYNAHYAIGGRGFTVNNPSGVPAGRGVAIGSFSQAHAGYCRGVMIEDFTDNQGASGGIPDADGGGEMNDNDGLFGPCHPVSFKNYTWYKVDLLISYLNVYWYLSEKTPGGWVIVAEGGCREDTGNYCPEDPYDRGRGDAFIANAGLRSFFWWTAKQPVVSKF